jgi:hypothetical protein
LRAANPPSPVATPVAHSAFHKPKAPKISSGAFIIFSASDPGAIVPADVEGSDIEANQIGILVAEHHALVQVPGTGAVEVPAPSHD